MTQRSSSHPRECVHAAAMAAAILVGVIAPHLDGAGASSLGDRVTAPWRSAETLYVVDTARYGHQSSVLAIDVSSGAVITRFPAGHQPDAIVSPDGSRLYVTSSAWVDAPPSWAHTLRTYDPKSGALLTTVETPDRLLFTADRYGSRMTMSPSGRFIYIRKAVQTVQHDEYYLAFFDTVQGVFLKPRADLFGCGDAVIVPSNTDEQVNVICGHAAAIRQFRLSGSLAEIEDVRVPIRERGPYQTGLVLSNPQTQTLTLIDQQWSLVQVNPGSRAVSPGAGAMPMPRSLQPGPGRWMKTHQHVIINGASVFMVTSSLNLRKSGTYSWDQIEKLNAISLKSEGVLSLSVPIFSMVRSPDGRTIYGVSPDAASIVVIDGVAMKEVRRLQIPAESPIFTLVSR
jgi:hypothetical protein